MRNKFVTLIPVLLAVLLMAGCSTDPEVAKRRYVENGNSYFDQGQYKQASIMYRNALKTDQRFGEAWYRLGLTQLKMGDLTAAYGSLRRAAELQPDNLDAKAQVADILMLAYRSDQRNRDQYLREIDSLLNDASGLKTLHPETFEAYRVDGSFDLLQASELVEGVARKAGDAARQDSAEAQKLFASAIEKLKKANSLKANDPGVVLTLARTLAVLNQFDESEKLVKDLLAARPDAALAYEFLFAQYTVRGRLADAEVVLHQAIKANPQQENFALQLAAFQRAQKKEAESVATLKSYLDRAEDKAYAHLRIGDYWARMPDQQKAQESYEAALKAPESEKEEAKPVEIRKRLADTLVAQNRVDEAKAVLEQVLKAAPEDAQANSMRAALLLRSGSREEVLEAITELEAAVSRAPDNYTLHYNLASAYMAKNPPEPDKARVQLEEAIRLRKSYIPAHIRLAQLFVQQGSYGAAESQAKQGLEQEPDNLTLREILALTQVEVQNFAAARENIRAVLDRQPKAIGALYQLGRLSLLEKKYDEAERAFRSVVDNNPDDPLARGLAGLVEVYKQRNQMDRALDLLAEEAKKNPDRFTVGLLLGDTAYYAKQYEVAGEQFDRMIAKYPQNPDLWARRGEIARLRGNSSKAIESFSKAAELNPDRKGPLLLLGLLHASKGEMGKARNYYNEVLKVDPDEPIALNNLAYIMVEQGEDLDRALGMVQRAKQRLPDNDEISDTLGWIYLKKNLHDNALQIFDQLVKNQPRNATFRYHLGMAHFQAGDRTAAKSALQTALQSGPSKEEEQKIRELLSQIG